MLYQIKMTKHTPVMYNLASCWSPSIYAGQSWMENKKKECWMRIGDFERGVIMHRSKYTGEL